MLSQPKESFLYTLIVSIWLRYLSLRIMFKNVNAVLAKIEIDFGALQTPIRSKSSFFLMQLKSRN